ncbi:MAG: alanine--tRNA ligase [Candidatus Bathyarchaeia archaeon]
MLGLPSLDSEFQLSFFKENGFSRRRCVICGANYWTQSQSSSDCGDSPCRRYTFIGNPPTNRSYSLAQLRELFLRYFEKNGHKIVDPYPVVARWRDDVYLVGASIYNFQPYVTDGALPPPANPLVISQPCIRFTDIDKTGQTFGRHMTIFEMGGAHAFNSKERAVYWKDETVRYHHELLTRELGVNSEDVSYKEDFWSGGGNAGPDVEACVAGLEISTLVFMMYKYLGEQLVEMPIKTVDTGYGMERWTWLSQGSPTGFHATYGHLMEEVADLAGISIDSRIIGEIAAASSTAEYKTALGKLPATEMIASKYGIPLETLDKTVSDLQSICAVLDHTKALCFLLSEGVVPSNMQEGYLARLLTRRSYRMLRTLGIESRFIDLVEKQIRYWSVTFPNLRVMRDEIVEALTVEQEKYSRTLEKGADLVRRLSRELKRSGMSEIGEEKLVELYDSHGLVPEIVEEFARSESIGVQVPDDFFGKVAQRHLRVGQLEEPPATRMLKESTAGYPATKRLYYDDPNLKEFKAEVLGVIDGRYLILDKTCFYSGGGGQLADSGIILFNGESSKVTETQSVGDVVVHTISGGVPAVGSEVTGIVDWERRLSLMRHHTSTHILIGAARRVLGEHAWQAGAAKDVEVSRLDISHYRHLTAEEVNEMERLACKVITKNLPVETVWTPRDEAERTYGYRLYQGGAVPGVLIRLVKIGDWDVEACGGTHVQSTGQIGIIKILRTERIQDGVERLIFASGPQALKMIQEREAELSESARILGTSPENLSRAAVNLLNEKVELARKLTRLRERVTGQEAAALLKKPGRVGGARLIIHEQEDSDEEETVMLGSKITKAEPRAVAVIMLRGERARIFCFAGKEAVKAGVHAGRMAEELSTIIGGGGGGRDYFGQGGGTRPEKLPGIRKAAKEILSRQLRCR